MYVNNPSKLLNSNIFFKYTIIEGPVFDFFNMQLKIQQNEHKIIFFNNLPLGGFECTYNPSACTKYSGLLRTLFLISGIFKIILFSW